MFDYLKKIAISNRSDDEVLYEYVLNEIENGIFIKGLWGKALANSDGNDTKAKSIYMKYRVQSIKDIFIAREIAYKELTKSKLYQYIQDEILLVSNDYANSSNTQTKEKNKISEYEEAIYNEVAEELSSEIRKEGLWLKAIQDTDGDESRALSLYIKYRSEALKREKAKMAEQERLKNEKNATEKAELIKKQKEEEDANDMQVGFKYMFIFIVIIIVTISIFR